MTSSPIPFNRSSVEGRELDYIRRSIEGGQIGGDQMFCTECHHLLEEVLGIPRALVTPSCTDALEASALLLGIHPGDEVIVPAFTFVSTANAFALRGARPVFCDVRPDTLNLDERQLESIITARTRAIVPVHYGGVGCEMDAILDIARRHDIAIVEDNAHGLFGKYRGRYLGTFGRLGALSFHETKNITSGEGGALLVNDQSLVDRAEIVREKGTDRTRFFRGESESYSWREIGSNFVMSDILAAFLFGQLEVWPKIQKRRREIWNTYDRELAAWSANENVARPTVPPHCEPSWHLYHLLLPSEEARRGLIEHLAARKILAVFHYLPLHLSECGRTFGGKTGQCPITEDVSKRLLRLPFFTSLTSDEQDRVIDAVLSFRC